MDNPTKFSGLVFGFALTAMLMVLTWASGVAAAKRVALVIANSNYEHAEKLSNPSNDAKSLAEAFRRLDFDTVTLKENLDYRNLRLALKDFANESAGAELALVYFAGHGIEVSGQNFLIPTDARLESASDIDFEGIPLTSVLSSVDGAKILKMVILDACRNNPFRSRMVMRSSTRSIGRGLAKVEPNNNTLVAFAAKEGTVALDGDSDHSPYANALLQVVEEPGVEIGFMFRRVRDLVLKATGQRQEPFTYGSLGGTPIYLKTPQKTADTKKSSESEDRISNLRRKLDELKRQFNLDKTSDSDVEKKSEEIVIAKAEPKTRENESVKITATKDKAQEQKGPNTQADFSGPVDSTKKGNDGSQTVASVQPNPTKLEKDAGAATGGPQVVAPQCPPGFTLSGGQCIRMGAGPGPRPQPGVDPEVSRRQLALDLQGVLKDIGCYTSRVDGLWGRGSQTSLERFNALAGSGLSAEEPTGEALAAVRAWQGGNCKTVVKRKRSKRTVNQKKKTVTRKKSTASKTNKVKPFGGSSMGTIFMGGGSGIGIGLSDLRLKRDVTYLATLESGIKVYAFRYLWDDKVHVGVMAQDLLGSAATREAVSTMLGGFYAVNYEMLGLKMTTLDAWRKQGLTSVLAEPASADVNVLPAALKD